MVFIGDIALPNNSVPSYVIPKELGVKTWLGNLEGSLVLDGHKKKGVYNNAAAIAELCKQIPFKAFNIANNHLLDAANVETTLDSAKKLSVSLVGAGCNLQEARRSLVVEDADGSKIRILSYGWGNIQCLLAGKNKQGVNPYTRKNVVESVKEALKQEEPVICFMHWNYELEKYPQPYDRQLAMELIDMGVSAVIGCHAHRVQPIEFYKGRPIVYGLGNFLFYQGSYFGGKLSFPKSCEEEYAFEISAEGYRLHHFRYDQKVNRLEYVKSEVIGEGKEYEGKAIFSGFDAKEYERFFKNNRVQKKLLPVFLTKETNVSYWMKSTWIKLRGLLLDLATRFQLKSAERIER